MNLFDEVTVLPKVGEKTKEKFNTLNIFTLKDLLFYYPRRYENRKKFKKIKEIQVNESVAVKGEIFKVDNINLNYRKSIVKAYVKDETGVCVLNFFNQKFILLELEIGRKIFFYGKAIESYKGIEFSNFEYEFDQCGKKIGLIYPVYGLTKGLKNYDFIKAIDCILETVDLSKIEYLKSEVLSKEKLISNDIAIKNIHFPKSRELFLASKYRIIFNEFFELYIFLNISKNNIRNKKGISFKKDNSIENIIKNLPFQLTNAQRRVVFEILQDMERETPMRRLVEGDVGSGKTIVSFIVMYNVYKNGFQSALMVPTEVLAMQHYENAKEFFGNIDKNINVCLLTGSTRNKNKIYEDIKLGKINIVIGTQALIQENLIFNNLGFIVTDEQHRFGVNQRKNLKEKGDINPDVLVMSATPIPRTLSLVVHNDLDISVIDEMPKNRKPVKTIGLDSKYEKKVFEFVKKELDKNNKAYFVCPFVEENENMDVISVEELFEKLKKYYEKYDNVNIGYLHGKMKPKEKEKVIKNFYKGNINVLVSTSVIEVGIDEKDATVMVIYNGERFGLAALHQLRGRVGRSNKDSYCIVIHNAKSEISKKRIQIFVELNDGFSISLEDCKLRGGGDVLGTKQHGFKEFKIADIYEHSNILIHARKVANKILQDSDKNYFSFLAEKVYEKIDIS